MGIYATQRGATRNQSTVDFQAQNIFTYGNRYNNGTLINNTGDVLVAEDGFLVVRNFDSVDGFSPATDVNLAYVIGILKIEGKNEIADEASLKANYCISGDIDATMLLLPDGVTLDTEVGNKSLKDVLTALGFVLNNVTEMTKFNN